MSELKVYHCNEWHNEYTEFYIKSEADKVIADLEESHKKEVGQLLIEIAELKKEKEYVIEQTADVINGQERELRNHKYKRCLAMAKWCMSRYNEWAAYYPTTTTRKMKFLDKWEKRWRKLAEKFKTNSPSTEKEAPMPCNGKKSGGKKPPKK